MRTSEAQIARIKASEGFKAVPSNDAGALSWGYGHDRRNGELVPISVTEEQGDALLRADLPRYEAAVERLAPKANQNQFDALVDFCYNLGPAALATMLSHGIANAPSQMLRWIWVEVDGQAVASEALAKRREAESELFEQPVS